MIYTEDIILEGGATVRISSFGRQGGAGESHVVITITDPTLSLGQQMLMLLRAEEQALSHLPSNRRVAFKRYLLSDASSQADFLPDDDECAVSIVQQPPVNGSKIALWLYAIDDAKIQSITTDTDKVVQAEHGAYRHIWFTQMSRPNCDPDNATAAILNKYAAALGSMGLTLADNCMRTWIYVKDIDNKYHGVVTGRNRAFAAHGLTPDTHFIASTGIAGASADPNSFVLIDAYAVSGLKPGQVRYLTAPDNMNPTHEYGVAFERGTSIDYGDRRHVLISGTASINNRGEVVHVGDVVQQTARMLSNVEALMLDAECGWADVAQAIVYLRNASDYRKIAELLAARLGGIPYLVVEAPVCRPTWLIEIECMAILPASNPQYPNF